MKLVVSLSRRTEPYFYGGRLVQLLTSRYPPERVHTVVIWTKFPQTVLEVMRDPLKAYDQVYVHLTITGLGGTPIEPHVFPPEQTLAQIPDLIDFLGDPRRLRVRPDPLLIFRRGGKTYSNLRLAADIIREAAALGVKNFSASFVEMYPKVKRRLQQQGWTELPLTTGERQQIWNGLAGLAAECGAVLHACCIPEGPVSRCIDGYLLTELHPLGEPCRLDKAQGQRTRCGCTHSVDLGWYHMKCPSGCLYCYANSV
ncbi:MAG: DUF1848 family protein [Moorellaceae bacterium]